MKVTVYGQVLFVTALCIANLVHSISIDKTLKVLTYNTALMDKSLVTSVPNNRIERRDEIINLLKNQDSDVVCLQEVFIGDDMELIVDGLNTLYPHSFSQLHIFDGTLPSQNAGYKRPACNKNILSRFLVCTIQNGCPSVPISEFRTCAYIHCARLIRELFADGGCQCANCILVTELDYVMNRCTTYILSTNNRHMNPSGLLLLSKKSLSSRTFEEYYPSTVKFLSNGYITADIGDGTEVVCTHLSPYDQNTGESELSMYFPTYADQTVHQINHLIDLLSNSRKPTILMGDFNVSPEGADIEALGSELYAKLFESFDTKLVSACTFCSGWRVEYNTDEHGTNTVLDHVMVNSNNIKINSVTRMFTVPLVELDDQFPSDHFGVQAVLKINT